MTIKIERFGYYVEVAPVFTEGPIKAMPVVYGEENQYQNTVILFDGTILAVPPGGHIEISA